MVPKTLYYNLKQGNNDPRQWGFSVDVCMWEGGGQGLIYFHGSRFLLGFNGETFLLRRLNGQQITHILS